MRPDRTRWWFSAGVTAFLTVLIALGAWQSTATRSDRADDQAPPAPLGARLIQAIRDGDTAAVRDLLARGADVNARDEGGATALMQAVLNADATMVDLLLTSGADVNARNKAETSALLWALHDPGKVKLLLDRGATVPDQAAVIAAGLANSRRTLHLLADKGAKLNASWQGYPPLLAAVMMGSDLDAIHYLLKQGADVNSAAWAADIWR